MRGFERDEIEDILEKDKYDEHEEDIGDVEHSRSRSPEDENHGRRNTSDALIAPTLHPTTKAPRFRRIDSPLRVAAETDSSLVVCGSWFGQNKKRSREIFFRICRPTRHGTHTDTDNTVGAKC